MGNWDSMEKYGDFGITAGWAWKHETLEFLGGSQKSVSLVCKGNSGNPMNIIPQKHVVDKIAFVENHVKYPFCVDEIHVTSHLVSGPEGL